MKLRFVAAWVALLPPVLWLYHRFGPRYVRADELIRQTFGGHPR